MQGSFLKTGSGAEKRGIQVKICGFTKPENVREAAALPADAFGFVLFAKSKRRVTEEELPALLAEVPARVTPVLLLVDPEPEQVLRLAKRFPQVMLQFHGNEPRELCELSGLPYMKAVHFREPGELLAAEKAYPAAAGILADCPAPESAAPGGNGIAFDWKAAEAEARRMAKPLVVAGGLRPENAAEAARLLAPAALDVSSGVESAPGIKDMMKSRKFLEAVKL